MIFGGWLFIFISCSLGFFENKETNRQRPNWLCLFLYLGQVIRKLVDVVWEKKNSIRWSCVTWSSTSPLTSACIDRSRNLSRFRQKLTSFFSFREKSHSLFFGLYPLPVHFFAKLTCRLLLRIRLWGVDTFGVAEGEACVLCSAGVFHFSFSEPGQHLAARYYIEDRHTHPSIFCCFFSKN